MPEPSADERLERGERAALPSWFAAHREELRGFVSGRIDPRMRRRVDPSDVVQQVFLDADARFDRYAEQSSATPFGAWIRQIARQTLIDLHRRHVIATRRSVRREVDLDRAAAAANDSAPQGVSKLPAADTSPSGVVQKHEQERHLERAMERLGPLDQEILRLRHFDGLGNRDVAARLGIAVTAASNRYVRALRRLSELLNDPVAVPPSAS